MRSSVAPRVKKIKLISVAAEDAQLSASGCAPMISLAFEGTRGDIYVRGDNGPRWNGANRCENRENNLRTSYGGSTNYSKERNGTSRRDWMPASSRAPITINVDGINRDERREGNDEGRMRDASSRYCVDVRMQRDLTTSCSDIWRSDIAVREKKRKRKEIKWRESIKMSGSYFWRLQCSAINSNYLA